MAGFSKIHLSLMSPPMTERRCKPTTLSSSFILMYLRWHEAIRTLGKLHNVDANEHGLSDFGKPNGFYSRQVKTLSTISASQAQAVDVESNVAVGNIPHFDEMVEFFRDPATQPVDRTCVIHGDYKIDNLVFHRTKPRVIGILE